MRKLSVLMGIIFLSLVLHFFIVWFSPTLPNYENAVLLARKHLSLEMSLPNDLINTYKNLSSINSGLTQIDKMIPKFPSAILTNYWQEKNIYFLIIFPIILLVSLSVLVSRRVFILFNLLFIFWLLPTNKIISNLADSFVEKTQFRLITPFTPRHQWLWTESDNKENQILTISYTWNQNNLTQNATLKVSCLGHYQANINGTYYYQGPVFSQYPNVYYDEINIAGFIKKGTNKIQISCQYLNVKTHEHQTFSFPGVLIGGKIKDGLLSYTLSDQRLWQKETRINTIFNARISADTGFAENTDYTKDSPPEKLKSIFPDITLQPRPISLLKEEVVTPKQINATTYDLGKYSVGYLLLKTNFEKSCTLKTSFFSSYQNTITQDAHENQDDQFTLPSGQFSTKQFSRRAGRFIILDRGDCLGDLEISISKPYYPIEKYSDAKIENGLDKKIFAIANSSITNGLQDQIEDSVVRERALYIGDAYATYSCLPQSSEKNNYFKYILTVIAASQKGDGSLPAMAHSQNDFVIPSYTLIFPIFLGDYLAETNDISFIKSQLPTINKVLSWIKSNQDEAGFITDKNKLGYWNFIDWTSRDMGYQYDTSLQIYLLKALTSINSIYQKLGQDYESISKDINALQNNLYTHSFNFAKHEFADSFALDGNKSFGGIITNSLAGKYGIFPSTEESNLSFTKQKNFNTRSPYSQSWLAEWAIRLEKKEDALAIVRRYWGSMTDLEASSVYETFIPGDKRVEASHSHIWGCSPAFILNQLYQ